MSGDLDTRTDRMLSAKSADVSYQYGHISAVQTLQLQQVALSLTPGELTAVIGPNGSGKSTLVRALSRTLEPVRGAILLDGSNLYSEVSARESAQSIAVVPQSTDVFLDFTVREIVSMGRASRRAVRGVLAPDSIEDEAAVDAALTRMGIGQELSSRPISQVSGGERQRALIARSLAQEAPILILDEPTAALDLRTQQSLLAWLRSLAVQERRSVLVVLHDLNIAAGHADRLIVLSKGRVVADGPVIQVLTPELIESVYGVRAWVRSNPANGRLSVVPLGTSVSGALSIGSAALPEKLLMGRRIHLFCGAGTGARLMFLLTEQGAALSASILHQGDADKEAADALEIDHATAEPFSNPDDVAIDSSRVLAAESGAAVLTDVPLGEVNRTVFDEALKFAQSGKPLVVVAAGAKRAEFEAQLKAFSDACFVATSNDVLPALYEQLREGRG